MTFEVYFSAQHTSVQIKTVPTGLAGIDTIRQLLDLPQLPLAVIHPETESLYASVTIPISESIARKSGLFESKNTVTVSVPNAYLSPYAEPYVKTSQEADGAISFAKLSFTVNKEKVLADWIAAGFPEIWGHANSTVNQHG